MNDYFLGGKDNFAVDREAAEQVLAIAPEVKTMAEENRAFLSRAVRFLAEEGVRQFIDVGSGLPSRRNSSQTARAVAADCNVVYVDHDPIVLSHDEAILAADDRIGVVEGSIPRFSSVLADPRLRRVIDLEEPAAVLIFGALQLIATADDPYKMVACIRDSLAPGSYLAISHVVFDTRPEAVDPIEDIYRAIFDRPGATAARTSDDVMRFFDGFELVEPGLTYIRRWRPENPLSAAAADNIWMVGGVGRKL
jgi:SAM-dependent methyltransferase